MAQIVGLLSALGLIDGDPPAGYDERVELAVRAFQQQRGLHVDGVVGPETFRRLDEARWSLGDRILTHLPGQPDGRRRRVRAAAAAARAGLQGGPGGRLLRPGDRGGAARLPAQVRHPGGRHLRAGHAQGARPAQPDGLRRRPQRDARPASGSARTARSSAARSSSSTRHRATTARGVRREAAEEIVHDLAARIEGRLVATGVQAFLTASPGPRRHRSPAPGGTGHAEEARDAPTFANAAGANLCVSLAVDASANPDACGVATYFFGSERPRRPVHGRRALRQPGAARDHRPHGPGRPAHATPKAWDLLRRTRMPAVRLEAGYLTNPGDARRLADPGFRDVIAEAVVVAVQRFYLSPEADAHTGVLRLSELRAGLAARSQRRPRRLSPADPRAGRHRRAQVGSVRRRRVRRPRPSSRSARPRAPRASDKVVRRSIRIRGCSGCGRWVRNPTASRKSTGRTHSSSRGAVRAERLDRADVAAPDRSLATDCTSIRPRPPSAAAAGRRTPRRAAPRPG